MIQSTDNLEATKYTHQCGDIFLKLSNLNEKSDCKVTTSSKLADLKSPVNKEKLSKKVNDKSTNKLNEKSNDKLTNRLKDKSSDKLYDDLIDKSNKANKFNHKLNNKSIEKPIEKSIHKSNDKLIDKKKKDLNIPKHSNRKRSDIENIFDLNSIKRIKAEMSHSIRPLVFCGPSGAGKSSFIQKLRNDFPHNFGFSISRKFFFSSNLENFKKFLNLNLLKSLVFFL